MKLSNLKRFIYDEELEINVFLNKVDIVNYKSIGHFDNSKVYVYHDKGTIKVIGDNLIVSKLLNNEVLITGKIKQIELG